MAQLLMVYYELENNDRLQKIRGILERYSIECKHYNDNITFIKSDAGPADIEDWFRMELSDKETFLITRLVFTASTKPPKSGVFEWVGMHDDKEFDDFVMKAMMALNK